jgi:hypothetical protein
LFFVGQQLVLLLYSWFVPLIICFFFIWFYFKFGFIFYFMFQFYCHLVLIPLHCCHLVLIPLHCCNAKKEFLKPLVLLSLSWWGLQEKSHPIFQQKKLPWFLPVMGWDTNRNSANYLVNITTSSCIYVLLRRVLQRC